MPAKDLEGKDIWLLEDIYPDPLPLLQIETKTAETLKNDSIIVLDASILLMPFRLKKESIDEIKKLYADLVSKEKIYIPSRALKEYIANRKSQLDSFLDTMNKYKWAKWNIPEMNPLLRSIPNHEKLIKIHERVASYIESKRKEHEQIWESIKMELTKFRNMDPVTQAYRDVFSGDHIVSLREPKINVEKKWKERFDRNPPPGHKDSSKPDGGIGDYLIWETILQIGADKNSNIIFVTNDEKSDWMSSYSLLGRAPRFELLYEYFVKSNGKSFCMINFSDFLSLFTVKEETVKEVKNEEKYESIVYADTIPLINEIVSFNEFTVGRSIGKWFEKTYPECKVTYNSNGFDLIVQDTAGVVHGVEKIFVANDRQWIEKLARAVLKFNSNIEGAIILAFVGKNEEMANKIANDYEHNPNYGNYGIIIGYHEQPFKYHVIKQFNLHIQ